MLSAADVNDALRAKKKKENSKTSNCHHLFCTGILADQHLLHNCIFVGWLDAHIYLSYDIVQSWEFFPFDSSRYLGLFGRGKTKLLQKHTRLVNP